ncbi:MAG TPA: helix-turn-helix domain-containing protein [Candidatus Eremiobacteraceae bacterium]|nr:helix-turn-helix domain-containing protein [Candidatus Eremiobacteraceae bacterium]
MREASFFQSTRGRIVESLQRRGPQTVAELAAGHELTNNAIRQHLARLERDGLVVEATERRGPTKPSLVFSLTAEGRRLFPQRYSTLLNAVLEEIGATQGREKVKEIFHSIGQRSARKYARRFEGKGLQERVAELTAILREQGVVADYESAPDGFVLREHTCPFRDTVATNPEVCSVVHALMEEVLPAKAEQRLSIARGDDTCEFAIPATGGK